MICSREDTDEGREPEKVSIKTDKPGKGIYLLPLAVAAPVAAAVALGVLRFWPTIHKLLSIVIKLVVKA